MATKKTEVEKKEVDMDAVQKAAVTNLVAMLQEKTFNSGKTGFYAQNKIVVDGVRYQCQIMMVEIAPK